MHTLETILQLGTLCESTLGQLILSMKLMRSDLTSSTAQGGGGSFKNRKPIGEIGCCEPRMTEQKH